MQNREIMGHEFCYVFVIYEFIYTELTDRPCHMHLFNIYGCIKNIYNVMRLSV